MDACDQLERLERALRSVAQTRDLDLARQIAVAALGNKPLSA